MAKINRVVQDQRPEGNGKNFQAHMSDGSVITFGPCVNSNYAKRGYWFVSLEGKPHSTFIVDISGKEAVVQAISARGSEKAMWENFAVNVVHGLWNV